MQEARAEARGRWRRALPIAHSMTDGLERGFVRVIHLDEAEEGKIIAGFEAAEMRAHVRSERGIFSRCLLQSGPIFFVGKELDAVLLEDW